ncbi:tripartite motif-containing protein 2-like [Amphiura filiformis]|uniref:tripartite motif-containing protein 2-like n=1 Tax=Amphiura filiformis TaxID=82378 RepID=UPI003B228C26
MANAGNQEAYNSLQVIAGQLDCSICANRLSDPKDLDCSHTFCCKCLTDYARSKKLSTVIACPLCRQNTVLPPGGITYLKTNYLLRDVIDAVPLEDARLPKRRLDPLEEKDGTRTCGVHNGVARDIYCATCNVLVCQKCIGTGHCSTGHSHYSLHTRASYARNYLKTLSSESAGKLADLDSMQEEIRKAEETLRENRQKTMEKIGEHVMKVTTVVLEQQSSLIKEVDAKYLADVAALEREKERIATLRENLQQYHDETQMTARNQDDETVVLLESKLDSDKILTKDRSLTCALLNLILQKLQSNLDR